MALDQACFKNDVFSGDRPGDLAQVKVYGILRFPNDICFPFNHAWGRTLRDGDENVFGIRRNLHTTICPTRGIEQYIEEAREMRVDLTRGYLFRSPTPSGGIHDFPLRSSTAEARLKEYLKDMGADEGETLHGFRSGCAITLAFKGAALSEITENVGWSRRHTAAHIQLAKVLNPDSGSARPVFESDMDVINPQQNMNELKRVVSAFPSKNPDERSHQDY